jgi:hypothetical protein
MRHRAPAATMICDILDNEINFLRERVLTAASEEERLAVIRDLGVMLLAKDYFAAKVKTRRVEPDLVVLPKPDAAAPKRVVLRRPVTASAAGTTLEDVRSTVIEAIKRTSANAAQNVVMAHGGKAPMPKGGEGPSLKALPTEQFAACVAALRALPTTR